MKTLKYIFKAIIITFVLALIGLVFISRGNSFEAGIKDNQLAPCPDRPNCVSSYKNNEDSNYLRAIDYSHDLEPIQEKVKTFFDPGTTIISEKENYMHCAFKAGIWTDDVEFVFDTHQNKIHFRSSSRWGYGDMDANKKRMNRIREKIQKAN